jgi:predicted alpha-1,6-mannanase (GH76 family)
MYDETLALNIAHYRGLKTLYVTLQKTLFKNYDALNSSWCKNITGMFPKEEGTFIQRTVLCLHPLTVIYDKRVDLRDYVRNKKTFEFVKIQKY